MEEDDVELRLVLEADTCRGTVERRQARSGSAGQFRDLLTATPGEMPPLVEVAAALAVSERTLRRRLDDEGTSYRTLGDEVREIWPRC